VVREFTSRNKPSAACEIRGTFVIVRIASDLPIWPFTELFELVS